MILHVCATEAQRGLFIYVSSSHRDDMVWRALACQQLGLGSDQMWIEIVVYSYPNFLFLPLRLLKTFAGFLFVQVLWFSFYHKNQHFQTPLRSGHSDLYMGRATIDSCSILFLHVSIPVVSFPSCLRYLNIALMLHLFPKSSTSGSGHLEYMDKQLKC